MHKLKHFFLDRDTQDKTSVLEEYYVSQSDEDQQMQKASSLVFQADAIVNKPKDVVLGKDVLRDIEMFEGYYKGETTVFSCLDTCNTQGGKLVLRGILANPTRNVSKLNSRQDVTRRFKDAMNDTVADHLQALKRTEKHVFWVLSSEDCDLSHLFDLVYFSTFLLRPLNNQGTVLTFNALYKIIASPLIGIITPLTYIIVPYLVLIYQLKIGLSFTQYVKSMWHMFFAANNMFGSNSLLNNLKYVSYALSLLFYFQGLFNSFEIAKLTHHTAKIIYNNMKGFVEFVQSANWLNKNVWNDQVVSAFDFTDNLCDKVIRDYNAETTAVKSTQSYFEGITVPDYSIMTNFGNVLSMFKNLRKQSFIPLIMRAYVMDAIVAVATCVTRNKMTFPEFLEGPIDSGPVLKYQCVRHPCIAIDKAIPNDIAFGGDAKGKKETGACSCRLAILTGPNAGGKSTMLKSVLSNIVLAQTIGLACVDAMTLTPFAFINSQINIPDCKGKESLFEAEMNRSHYNFEAINNLENSKSDFAFIAMDEVFNSTNPVEGIAGAYAILQKLSSFPNTVTMVTTHYLYLTKLAKDVPSIVKNYKMNVQHDEITEDISFPYKMTNGISRQFIALKLLKQAGYDRDILDNAEAIKMRLMVQKAKA